MLDDDERARIGTLYAASALRSAQGRRCDVARNIAAIRSRLPCRDKPRDWAPLVYCWRGGQRSRALDARAERDRLARRAARGRLSRLSAARCGRLGRAAGAVPLSTSSAGSPAPARAGSLPRSRDEGAQVIDLERWHVIADRCWATCPRDPQPSQKSFETQLVAALEALRPGASRLRRVGEPQDRHAAGSRCACWTRCAPHRCFACRLPRALRVALLKRRLRALSSPTRRRCAQARAPCSAARQEDDRALDRNAAAGDWDRGRRTARPALRPDLRVARSAELSTQFDARRGRRRLRRALDRRTRLPLAGPTRSKRKEIPHRRPRDPAMSITQISLRIVNVFAQDRRSMAIRWRCSKTDAAWTTRRCRRWRCNSTCRRRRSSCRQRAHGARADLHADLRDAFRRTPDAGHRARRSRESQRPATRVTLEMRRASFPWTRRRRHLDARGECRRRRARSRRRATSSPRCWACRRCRARSGSAAAVGRHGLRATGDSRSRARRRRTRRAACRSSARARSATASARWPTSSPRRNGDRGVERWSRSSSRSTARSSRTRARDPPAPIWAAG